MPTDWASLKVVDLKEECRTRNLLVGGKKAELVARLEEFEASEGGAAASGDATKPAKDVVPEAHAQPAEEGADEAKPSQAAPATAAKKAKQKSSTSDSQTASQSGKAVAAQAAAAATEITIADEPVPTSPPEKHSTDDNAARHELAHAAVTPVESATPATTVTKAETKKGQSHFDTPVESHSAKAKSAAKTPKAGAGASSAPQVVDGEHPATEKKAAPTAAATPVLEAATPAVEAPATQPIAAASATPPLVPATEVKVPATAPADAPTPEVLPASGAQATTSGTEDAAAPMEVDRSDAPEQPDTVASAKATQSSDAITESVKPNAAKQSAVKTTAEAVPLAASLTDAAMADAAVEDAEMVQYDEPEEDEQVPAAKEPQKAKKQTPAASKRTDDKAGSRSHAKDDVSASARKRGREDERVGKDDRKTPRTEQKSDARSTQSHRDKDRERERERDREKDKGRDRDRARASDRDRGTRANGDAPTEQRRKHAPISYKPPERTSSQPKRDTAADAGKAPEADTKDGKPGLEQKTSGLDRSVSRTESGHKLSVFERLRRNESSGKSALPSSREGSVAAAPAPGPAPAAGPRQTEAPLGRTSSHSRRNQPTRALRIDGFVRPLTEPKARAMLSSTGEVEGMWMPTIRTHAYVIYATQEQAENTFQATLNKEWPEGNRGRLLPKFVPVSEAEAAIARAGGAGPPTAAAPPPVPQPAREVLPTQDAQVKAEPISRDADLRNRSDGARGGREEERDDRRGRDLHEDRRRQRDEDDRRVRGDDRRRIKDEPMPLAPQPVPQVPEKPPTLDDLFRKTTTLPALYWLPLTEEQAKARKIKLEAEAAAKAEASVPEANGAVLVS